MKQTYKLSYRSLAYNWFKPPRMVAKIEDNVFRFQPPKCLKFNFVKQLI